MSEEIVKKEVKKVITKNELLTLDAAWKDTKVGKLSNEATKDYFYLKIKVSGHVEKAEKQIKEAHKAMLAELGYKMGTKIAQEKAIEIEEKVNAVIQKIREEKIEIDTHILTFDELCNNLINYEPNKDVTTEDKATLMKYLLKE